MDDSILNSIKKMLGIGVEYDVFDADIIVLINSALSTLENFGVGMDPEFRIDGESQRWSDGFDPSVRIGMIQEFIYLRVRVIFDPPTTSAVIEAYKARIDELTWRLNVIEDGREVCNTDDPEKEPELSDPLWSDGDEMGGSQGETEECDPVSKRAQKS